MKQHPPTEEELRQAAEVIDRVNCKASGATTCSRFSISATSAPARTHDGVTGKRLRGRQSSYPWGQRASCPVVRDDGDGLAHSPLGWEYSSANAKHTDQP